MKIFWPLTIIVALAHGPRLDARGFGAGVGLGYAERLHPQLAACDLRQIALFLFRAAMPEQGAHDVHLCVARAGVAAAVINFLQDGAGLGDPKTRAAIFFGDQSREVAARRQRLHERVRVVAALVELAPVRLRIVRAQFAHALAYRLQVIGPRLHPLSPEVNLALVCAEEAQEKQILFFFALYSPEVSDGRHSRGGKRTMSIKPGWEGRCFEDFTVGDVYRCRLGRTVTEADNIWFTLLTNNTNQIHFNNEYGKRTEFGRCLINSALTMAIVVGMSTADVSENGFALGWDEIKLPNPLFAGDTLYSESEVLETRESKSKPQWGVVKVRTRGVQQDGRIVIELVRSVMVWKRAHLPKRDLFPEVKSEDKS